MTQVAFANFQCLHTRFVHEQHSTFQIERLDAIPTGGNQPILKLLTGSQRFISKLLFLSQLRKFSLGTPQFQFYRGKILLCADGTLKLSARMWLAGASRRCSREAHPLTSFPLCHGKNYPIAAQPVPRYLIHLNAD